VNTFWAFAVGCGFGESEDGAGTQDERKRGLVGESGEEVLSRIGVKRAIILRNLTPIPPSRTKIYLKGPFHMKRSF
jgi:hypothetical protein